MSTATTVSPIRNVLVTGATSGIGKAISARLLERGHRVVGVGRDFDKVDFESPRFHAEKLDLADLTALPEALRELFERFLEIDAVVLNAGRGELGSLEEFSYDRIHRLLDLNLTSQIYMARAVLPLLKRRKRGDLIFMGSEAALRGGRKGAVYCAAKFGLRGFAQALREECAKSGVRVTSIHPGPVRTPFFDDLPIAPGEGEDQALKPEDVAEAVLLALEQRGGAVVDEIVLSPLKRVVTFKK